ELEQIAHGLAQMRRPDDFSLIAELKHPGQENGTVRYLHRDLKSVIRQPKGRFRSECIEDDIDETLMKAKRGMRQLTVEHAEHAFRIVRHIETAPVESVGSVPADFHLAHAVNAIVGKSVVLFAVADEV